MMTHTTQDREICTQKLKGEIASWNLKIDELEKRHKSSVTNEEMIKLKSAKMKMDRRIKILEEVDDEAWDVVKFQVSLVMDEMENTWKNLMN